MSIRVPQRADREVQDAFSDADRVVSVLWKEVEALRSELTALRAPAAAAPLASHTNLGDVTIHGALHVAGDTTLSGDLVAPGQLDGFVGVGQTAGMSAASRVVEVHGSLAVGSAIACETLFARNLKTPRGLVYRLSTNVTDVGNVGTGEDTLTFPQRHGS